MDWDARLTAAAIDEVRFVWGDLKYDAEVPVITHHVTHDPGRGWDCLHTPGVRHCLRLGRRPQHRWGALVESVDEMTSDSTDAAELLTAGLAAVEDLGLETSTVRVIILDAVDVAPVLRGHGLGKQVAAYTLHAAGVWAPGAFVCAIQGSRERDDPRVEAAAGAICAAVGLQRTSRNARHQFQFSGGDGESSVRIDATEASFAPRGAEWRSA
jgi:hypothetical protein